MIINDIRGEEKFIAVDRDLDNLISEWHRVSRPSTTATAEAEILAKLSVTAYKAMQVLLGEDGVKYLCVPCFTKTAPRGTAFAYNHHKECNGCKQSTWCTRYKKSDAPVKKPDDASIGICDVCGRAAWYRVEFRTGDKLACSIEHESILRDPTKAKRLDKHCHVDPCKVTIFVDANGVSRDGMGDCMCSCGKCLDTKSSWKDTEVCKCDGSRVINVKREDNSIQIYSYHCAKCGLRIKGGSKVGDTYRLDKKTADVPEIETANKACVCKGPRHLYPMGWDIQGGACYYCDECKMKVVKPRLDDSYKARNTDGKYYLCQSCYFAFAKKNGSTPSKSYIHKKQCYWCKKDAWCGVYETIVSG